MKLPKKIKRLWIVGSAFLAICLGAFIYTAKNPQISTEVQNQGAVELPMIPLEEAFPHVIAPRTTLFSSLREVDVPAPTIQQIVDAAKPVQN